MKKRSHIALSCGLALLAVSTISKGGTTVHCLVSDKNTKYNLENLTCTISQDGKQVPFDFNNTVGLELMGVDIDGDLLKWSEVKDKKNKGLVKIQVYQPLKKSPSPKKPEEFYKHTAYDIHLYTSNGKDDACCRFYGNPIYSNTWMAECSEFMPSPTAVKYFNNVYNDNKATGSLKPTEGYCTPGFKWMGDY